MREAYVVSSDSVCLMHFSGVRVQDLGDKVPDGACDTPGIPGATSASGHPPDDPTRRHPDPTLVAAACTTVPVAAESAAHVEPAGETMPHSTPSLSHTPTPSLRVALESRASGGEESSQVTKSRTDVTGDEDGEKKTGVKNGSTPALDLNQDLFWLSFRNAVVERRFHEWTAGKRVRVCV